MKFKKWFEELPTISSLATAALICGFLIYGHSFRLFYIAVPVLIVELLSWRFAISWLTKPSEELTRLHTEFARLAGEIAKVDDNDARQRVEAMLLSKESFALTMAISDSDVRCRDLPSAVRELFSHYFLIECFDSVAKVGIEYIQPSSSCDGFITIGYIGEDDDDEVAIRAGEDTIYVFDRFYPRCDSFGETNQFRTIFHWFLFQQSVETWISADQEGEKIP